MIVPSSLPRACLHVRPGTGTKGRDNGTTLCDREKVMPVASLPPKGTLGGSNRMLSSREVAAILAVPERTVRDKWREWGLPAYRIGKHLRWRERDLYAWIEKHTA